MCSNCNNMNSFNNPNLTNGTVGFSIENGNNAVLGANTIPFNTGEIINTGCLSNNCNNNSWNCNNNCACDCNGGASNNNSCACNCNGNNNNNNNCDNDNITRETLQRILRNFIGRRVTLEFNNSR